MKLFKWLQLLLLIGLTGGIFFAGFRLGDIGLFSNNTEVRQELILEQVQKTLKLVTVEGTFSEIYSYKDYHHLDWAPFSKKALILVRARVLVGYDLEKMVFETDSETRTLWIRQVPEPELLAVEHELEFYDRQEGTFNSFSERDDNRLLKSARAFVEDRAMQSGISDRAREQFRDFIEVISIWAAEAGWKVEVESVSDAPFKT